MYETNQKENFYDINSIKLDFKDWDLQSQSNSQKIYSNKHGDILSINFFIEDDSLPESIHSLRHLYRDIVSQSNGAIIEVERVEINSINVIKTIFKFAQEVTGFTYVASYTIQKNHCSFVIKFECPEYGTTGLRESLLLLIAQKKGFVNEGTLEGWFSDPYDPDYQSQVLKNIGDDEEYDKDFPNHPLTRSRNYLKWVKNHLTIQ